MGCNVDCCQPPYRDHEAVQVLSDYQQSQFDEEQYRLGMPSAHIGVKIQDIPQQLTSQTLQKQIYRFKQNLLKTKKPLKLNRSKTPQNQLPDAYFLPLTNGFYIGEWVYDTKYMENLPKGIGRAYMEEWIMEGEIETLVKGCQNTQREVTETYKKGRKNRKFRRRNITQKFEEIVSQEKKLSMLTTAGVDYLVYYIKAKIASVQIQDLKIVLNGIGRKFNKNQEFEGTFVKGVLCGKGMCKIKENCYCYEGQWKNNLKHGKGIEKSTTFEYDGQFIQNQKHGKGSLTFHLDKQKKHQIAQQDERVAQQKQLQDQQQQNRQVDTIIQQRNRFQDMLRQKLTKYQWKNPYYNLFSQSVFDQTDFIKDQQNRTVFIEKYSGDFKDDQMYGIGSYQWSNGKKYYGQWKVGQMQGVGQFYWPDGAIYRGQYRNSLRYGKGEIIWCKSRRYRGSWAYGLRHGYGQMITINDNVLNIKGCLWNKDKQQKMFFENRIPLGDHEHVLYDETNTEEAPSFLRENLENLFPRFNDKQS